MIKNFKLSPNNCNIEFKPSNENYFAICAMQNKLEYPNNSKLFGKLPHEIILSNIKPLHLTACYIDKNNNVVENNLLNIIDWLIGKTGTIVLIDESAVCLSSGSINSLIVSLNNTNYFSAILNNNTVCAMAADINSLLLFYTSYNIGAITLNELYFNMLMHNMQIETVLVDNSELSILSSALNYSDVRAELSNKINQGHMRAGVFIMDSKTCYIDYDVQIGQGTVIHPNNTITVNSKIGSNCILYPNNRIENSIIANEVTIQSSVLIDSNVGNKTAVGPFAYLRPHSNIGENCRIGDFVEIKNSNIDNGTKVSHLTYVGDSDLGKNINLGCGVVFVNYDGKLKQRSTVEDNAFIGCNSNIIAPVSIGENSYIAAGSTITQSVPMDSLYIARSKGIIKLDWAKKRREDGKLK